MKNKLILTIILCASSLSTLIAQIKTPPYEIIVANNGFYSTGGINYTFVEIFLNNNSNETLYYRGTDCYNSLFNLEPTPYFHLATDICKSGGYIKTAIPPHRSQKMRLFLTMDKMPDKTVSLGISMKLYRWADDNSDQQKQHPLLGRLTDTIILYYNLKHEISLPADESPSVERKKSRILLNKDIYQLTDNDRKLYPLIIDKKHITQPHDTVTYLFKNNKRVKVKMKVINVPAYIRNDSNDELQFYSMSCSWDEFWGTDCNEIKLPGWLCEKNVTKVITLAPHQEYRRTLIITYDLSVKRGTEYRISMSLLKVPFTGDGGLFSQDPYDYVRYNKLWSGTVTIQ
ncbi:hypothetical protein AAFN85_01485 [Mucilaginibacter sp. CAU 1740]|uniref:hypothetical protein n=1 Tax=Mucilaginibacter sp. CAU 1740 TaxID=3140365 RepID=UPI00325B0854